MNKTKEGFARSGQIGGFLRNLKTVIVETFITNILFVLLIFISKLSIPI